MFKTDIRMFHKDIKYNFPKICKIEKLHGKYYIFVNHWNTAISIYSNNSDIDFMNYSYNDFYNSNILVIELGVL